MVNKFKDVIKQKGVKEYSDKKGKVGILAVHGGRLDQGTEQITNYIHEQTPASMYVMSSRQGDVNKHRVASTKIAHTHSDQLSDVISHSKYNISIHGHSKPGHEKTVYIGGENSYMRRKIAERLRESLPSEYVIEYDVKKMPRNIRGTGRNIVNRSEEGGVQVELPKELRQGVGGNDSSKLTGLSKRVGQAISEVVNEEFEKRPELHYKKGKEYKDDYAEAA
ncbi:poly-gamma-glutamate hydrolase family protein [Candidatus Woesearchaeota archaeon]|nr:poly-gamma-glutamate hydrolase family protein [Candidatus Woesearchaeota archaeon]